VSETSTHEDRVEAVKLAMIDALRYTQPQVLGPDGFEALRRGIELLRQSTFSEGEEEEWFISLLEAGWQLAPATSPASVSEPPLPREGP
jgi:hypothetical protein